MCKYKIMEKILITRLQYKQTKNSKYLDEIKELESELGGILNENGRVN